MKVAATRPFFSPASIEFILRNFREILEGKSFLSMFNHCETFEKAFAAYVGSAHATTCNSGTAALELALRAVAVKDCDVIVPTMTFAATPFAVVHAGGRPVFADCTHDLSVDPDDVRKRLTARTKVVITVHVGGLVSPHTVALQALCQEKGLLLIEDAAHAHGSALDQARAGAIGEAAAFSFFSTKVMTTGEGGMVTTSDRSIYEKCALLKNQAKVDNANYHTELGYNWRMAEVEALLGLAQLNELDDFIRRRNEIAQIYDAELAQVPALEILTKPSTARHNYYKYIAFLPRGMPRDQFHRRMKEQYSVAMGGPVYELPCHEQPVFREYATSPLPVAEDLARRHICPPIYYSLADAEAKHVARSIMACFQ